jgi:hypothetical protein
LVYTDDTILLGPDEKEIEKIENPVKELQSGRPRNLE